MRTLAQQVWRGGGDLSLRISNPPLVKLSQSGHQETVRPFSGKDPGVAASAGTNAHPTPWRFQGDHSAKYHRHWPREMDLIAPSHLAEASLPANATFCLPEQRLTGGFELLGLGHMTVSHCKGGWETNF